ncbi:MAG: YcaO-like family protein [Nitrospirae bacterium]|nr:YcaO-like family protein [Nitrospirota bacterium]
MMITQKPSLHRLASIVDALVDEHVGIVKYVKEFRRESGMPDFFCYYAKACNTLAFSPFKNFSNTGGASTLRELAAAKAIGEAVERYCSAIYDKESLPFTSFEKAMLMCVHPGEFALYSEEQYRRSDFPYVSFDRSTPAHWAPTVDMTTGETWYVPAAMVFMPFWYDQEGGEIPIVQPISTGLACHCSFEESAISAICEVIERDAFMITWQAGLAPPYISIDTLSPANQDLVSRFERTGNAVFLFHLAMDHDVPVVLAVARCSAEDGPALCFAASADLDPEDAVRKSLEELAHTRRLAQNLKSSEPSIAADSGFEAVSHQDAHLRFYGDQVNSHFAEFLFSGEKRVAFQEIKSPFKGDIHNDLRDLIDQVRSVNHRVLLADLTTSDVGDLGLSVVRAVIPGFHPLFMGHATRSLGGTRLWEIPQQLGYRGVTRKRGDNPAPHPYP